MNSGVAVIIPARYGSTRLPGKPLIDIAGKPLIEHVYRRAQQIPGVDEILVATDDERILEAVERFGGKAIITPGDCRNGSERVAWVAQKLSTDIVVNLQGDEPLVDTGAIGRAIQLMNEDPSLPVSTLGCPLETEQEWKNPSVVKVAVDIHGNALFFTRAPIPFFRSGYFQPLTRVWKHIGVYIFRRRFLLDYVQLSPGELETAEALEQLRILENGYTIRVVQASYASPGVDTPEDVARVESLMKEKGMIK